MMMMMRIMMMMNCFCGLVDRRKMFNLISSRDHFQRPSPSRIFDTPGARYEPAKNQSSGFVEWSCAAVITTTPRRHICQLNNYFLSFFWIYVYCSFGISLSSYFFSVLLWIVSDLTLEVFVILPAMLLQTFRWSI